MVSNHHFMEVLDVTSLRDKSFGTKARGCSAADDDNLGQNCVSVVYLLKQGTIIVQICTQLKDLLCWKNNLQSIVLDLIMFYRLAACNNVYHLFCKIERTSHSEWLERNHCAKHRTTGVKWEK